MKESNRTNSKVGSYHWFHTLIGQNLRIGEYLKDKTPTDMLIKVWGQNIYDNCKELIDGYKHINNLESDAKLNELAEKLYTKYTHLSISGEHWDMYDDKREINYIAEEIKNWANNDISEPWTQLKIQMPPKSEDLQYHTITVLFKYGCQYHTGSCNINTGVVHLDNGWEFKPGEDQYNELVWKVIE